MRRVVVGLVSVIVAGAGVAFSIRAFSATEQTAQRGAIYVYASGFTPEGNDLLQDLVDDLEVRRVQPSK